MQQGPAHYVSNNYPWKVLQFPVKLPRLTSCEEGSAMRRRVRFSFNLGSEKDVELERLTEFSYNLA